MNKFDVAGYFQEGNTDGTIALIGIYLNCFFLNERLGEITLFLFTSRSPHTYTSNNAEEVHYA